MPLPTEKELLEQISEKKYLNFVSIAKHFDIPPAAMNDLLKPLLQRKLVRIKKIGSNKMVFPYDPV